LAGWDAQGFSVEVRGIPHLAKNERDVGHPGFVAVWALEDSALLLGLVIGIPGVVV
jgi:hypothetical protein